MDQAFPIIILVAFAWTAYKIFSGGGVKGALLGGRITETLGSLPLKSRGPGNHLVRIHRLEGDKVGVEITSKAAFGFSMTGFSLPATDVDALVKLLQQASRTDST